MLTYLSLVTLPLAFAALTAFASAGSLPSMLAPIARLDHAVHGTVPSRALLSGLPAGRAALEPPLHHVLVVARSAPRAALQAVDPPRTRERANTKRPARPTANHAAVVELRLPVSARVIVPTVDAPPVVPPPLAMDSAVAATDSNAVEDSAGTAAPTPTTSASSTATAR